MPKQRSVSADPLKLKLKPVHLVMGAVAAAIIVVAALIAISQFSAKPPPETVAIDKGPSAEDECPNLISGYVKTMGSPEAPIEIMEFSDYQCPVCGRFAKDYQPRLIHDFVCTGKVRFTYKDFAFIGGGKQPDESQLAAQAASCAADQGRFWAYHDKLFANQRGENQGAFNTSKLKGFAQDLQLKMDTFSQCLDSGKYAAQVSGETQEGQRRGVNATPILFIDDQTIRGLPASYDDLRQAIEQALSKKR